MKTNINERFVFFKGEIMPIHQANIKITSTTAQYGINVFEGVRCYFNKMEDRLFAFRLQEHINRLFNSAKLIRFNLPEEMNSEYILNNLIDVVRVNKYKEDIYIKIVMFLDDEKGWSSLEPASIFIDPFPKRRAFSDIVGLDCCVSSWERINDADMPPRIKSGANYLNSRITLLEAKLNGYDYPIILNRNGKVSEGPGACIFMIRNNNLITPPVTASILESITRQSVIEFAMSEFNIKTEEREIDRTELYLADEIFFVGTSMEIVPVLSIDKIPINNNRMGEITKNLTKTYFNIVRGNLKKYDKWIKSIY